MVWLTRYINWLLAVMSAWKLIMTVFPLMKILKFFARIFLKMVFNLVFFGGEDYELVGSVSRDLFKKLIENNIPVIPIGKVLKADGMLEVNVKLNNKTVLINSEILNNRLFNHFEAKL
ncbi:MAG: hypothetical protein M0C28_15795 [Candidatus Moduliflexus flocculans]|nr:hypothetical protein [Candidatus Moduliflexus flocculans]